MFCRFAFRADFVRLATCSRPLYRETVPGDKALIVPRLSAWPRWAGPVLGPPPWAPFSLRLQHVHGDLPLATPLAHPDAHVKPRRRRSGTTPRAGVRPPGVAEVSGPRGFGEAGIACGQCRLRRHPAGDVLLADDGQKVGP